MKKHYRSLRCNMKNEVVLYIHGQGGNIAEARHYEGLFSGADIIGFDYVSEYPWDARIEFRDKIIELSLKYQKISVIANSIGAYFLMNADVSDYIDKDFFISPVVDMESLIMKMMMWNGVSEEELKEKKVIHDNYGDDLSYEYLEYVRNNPVIWDVKTFILYGAKDNLQSKDVIDEFVDKHKAILTVFKNSEHYIHTDEEMQLLDEWIIKNL